MQNVKLLENKTKTQVNHVGICVAVCGGICATVFDGISVFEGACVSVFEGEGVCVRYIV